MGLEGVGSNCAKTRTVTAAVIAEVIWGGRVFEAARQINQEPLEIEVDRLPGAYFLADLRDTPPERFLRFEHRGRYRHSAGFWSALGAELDKDFVAFLLCPIANALGHLDSNAHRRSGTH